MEIDDKAWQHLLYCSVFHNSDSLSNPQVAIGLLELFGRAFEQVSFDSTIAVNYVNSLSPTQLKPIERNWTVINKRLRENKITTLTYGSLHPNGYDFQVGVSLSFHEQPYLTSGSDLYSKPNQVSFWVDRSRLDSGISSVSDCIELMKSIWRSVDGVYGNADYFIAHRTGAVSGQQKLAAASRYGAKILEVEQTLPRVDLYREIPDVYWLNFLNAEHVKVLVANEGAKRMLSTLLVEELPQSGLAILLSPSPFVAENETQPRLYTLLRTALSPLVSESK